MSMNSGLIGVRSAGVSTFLHSNKCDGAKTKTADPVRKQRTEWFELNSWNFRSNHDLASRTNTDDDVFADCRQPPSI